MTMREKHDGLITVTFQKGVGVAVITNIGVLRVRDDSVLVDLAQVMEHTHDVRRTGVLPYQVIVLGEFYCHMLAIGG